MGEYFRRRKQERGRDGGDGNGGGARIERFSQGYAAALARIDDETKDCRDLIERPVTLAGGERATFFYFDGLVNQDLLQRDLLPCVLSSSAADLREARSNLPIATIKNEESIAKALEMLCSGYVILVVDGWPSALIFELIGWEKRNVDDSVIERNIRGPHESFTENLRVNTALLRRRLRTPQLKFKEQTLGWRTKTTVALAYLEGVARPELIKRLEDKIGKIDLDAVQAAGYIEQLTSERPYSPFPQYMETERVDRALANLLEGGILAMVDGDPAVLIAPVSFFHFFQAFDDYSRNWIVASVLRFISILAIFLAIFLPSFYIALLTFHYEAIPWPLLITLAQARSKVPFPPLVEAMIMEFIIELIREAAVRLPAYIGPVIGITGGLVIGQAVVAAGIVSNVMIIVVGVTAIASFVMPAYEMAQALRLIRFPIMIVSSLFGVVGLISAGAVLLAHLLSLESLGQPYFAPLAPLQPAYLKDTFIRAPLGKQGSRPKTTRPVDAYRGKGRKGG